MSSPVYALTEHGRVLHLVMAELIHDTDIVGAPALCGRRVARHVHPSDHENGGRVCVECEQKARAAHHDNAGEAT